MAVMPAEIGRLREGRVAALVRRLQRHACLGLEVPLPQAAARVVGKELGDDALVGVLLGDEHPVVAAVDLHAGIGRAAGGDPDLPQPGVRQPVVHEGPVAAGHVEHQLLDAVELAVGIALVKRDVELNLRAVAVQHRRLRPGRLAVQLQRRVGDRLAPQVEHDRMADHEVVPRRRQRRQLVELAHDARPFVGGDVDRVGPDHVLIEQIGAGRPAADGRRRIDEGSAGAARRHPAASPRRPPPRPRCRLPASLRRWRRLSSRTRQPPTPPPPLTTRASPCPTSWSHQEQAGCPSRGQQIAAAVTGREPRRASRHDVTIWAPR